MKSVFTLMISNILVWGTYASVIMTISSTTSKQLSQVGDKSLRISRLEDLNCKIKGDDKCEKCYPSFYYNLVSKICVPVNPLCLTSNDEGDCLSCFEGYKLVIGVCAIETDLDLVSKIKDPNCFTYVNETCAECAFRFYFNKEGICTTVHPDCQTWDNQTGACTSCFEGFQLKEARCYSEEKNNSILKLSTIISPSSNSQFTQIPNCAEYNGSDCAVCAYRYYKFNGSCWQVSDLCKGWSGIDGSCTHCYSGYDLEDGRCTLRDPFCTIKVTGICVQCASRYYLDLKLKCQGVNPLCKDYDPLQGTCTDCYQGYVLEANRTCISA